MTKENDTVMMHLLHMSRGNKKYNSLYGWFYKIHLKII